MGYYDQESIWNKTPEPYQIQALADVLSMIREGVQSVVDVGCGNGLITNHLPDNLRVVGLDISAEALKCVQREKAEASITQIPYPDRSFDLAIASDILEHLNDEDYARGIEELFRVSSKYVIVAVPYGEQLERSRAKCAECGSEFHVNLHQRRFLEEDLLSLCPRAWRLIEVRYSGDVTRPPADPTVGLRHDMRIFAGADNAVCPACGGATAVTSGSIYSGVILDKMYGLHCYSEDTPADQHVDRSEIIALYARRSLDAPSASEETCTPAPDLVYESPLVADLSNPLQEVVRGFVRGTFWARYLRKPAGEGQPESIWFQFPAVPCAGDVVEVQMRSAGDDAAGVRVFGHDPIRNRAFELQRTACDGSTQRFRVDREWTVDAIGACVSVFSAVPGTVSSVRYVPAGQHTRLRTVPFIRLGAGHNVLGHRTERYVRSWGLRVDAGGLFPYPTWLFQRCVRDEAFWEPVSAAELFIEMERAISELKRETAEVMELLESTEQRRAEAERAYSATSAAEASLRRELAAVKALLESTEQRRAEAEDARAALAKVEEACRQETARYRTLFLKMSRRRINRVLVLSHMFPNPQQENLGCFVAEQVKALREYEDIDARVVSCQPFWINTVNPVKVVRALRVYASQTLSAEWFTYEGVPTLFIPYLVGYPMFPFHVRGITYSAAVARRIARIKREFNFDLVHAHTGFLDGSAGVYVARRFQVPLVITEHTGPFSYLTGKPIVRQTTVRNLSLADKVICVSPALLNEVSKWLPAEAHQRMVCVPNGVDSEVFTPVTQPGSGPAEARPTHGGPRLLSVTALDNNKSPLMLLEAFDMVLKSSPQCTLTIVGDGPLKGVVQAWVRENAAGKRVRLIGRQPREEIARLMADECDVFVLSSKSETFGVVLIEAMAAGKPIVSTRCGGPESIITESHLGELCDNEATSLAEAINRVIRNLGAYQSSRIRAHAVEKYGYHFIAKTLSDLYENLA